VLSIATCLATLAALAVVSADKNYSGSARITNHNQAQQRQQQDGACASLKASGLGVYATQKAAGYGQRAAAEDADGPAACRVEFSLRAPAVDPAVAFTGRRWCYSSSDECEYNVRD
jgi:hypothetical protein